jgi:hypothetical protein
MGIETATNRGETICQVASVPQLARRLRVSQAWLRDEAAAGRLPAVPAGARNFLFNVEAVERVLAKRAALGESQGGAK